MGAHNEAMAMGNQNRLETDWHSAPSGNPYAFIVPDEEEIIEEDLEKTPIQRARCSHNIRPQFPDLKND